MAGKTIVILWGGFGGLSTAQQLCRALPPQHRVVVVERKDTFYLGSSNMRLVARGIKGQNYPSPRVYLEPPSERHHDERRKLELYQLEGLV